MMRAALIIITCSLALWMQAQNDFDLVPVQGIGSPLNEIACGFMGDKLIFCANNRQDLVSNYNWSGKQPFHIELATRGDTWSTFTMCERIMGQDAGKDEGTATYCAQDSTLYFSSAVSYGNKKFPLLCIYASRWNGTTWSEPRPLPFCSEKYKYAHPTYDARNKLLVFSSDQPGGQGGMDLWISYKIPGGWTKPVNMGSRVNSKGNEIFPTIYKSDIYFSSDGKGGLGGYDLFMALKSEQYRHVQPLTQPMNSLADDIMILFLDDETGFITSNRPGGQGGDDIFLFRKKRSTEAVHMYTALLEYKGQPLLNAEVKVSNALNEVVLNGNTASTGRFSLQPLDLSKRYKLKVTGVNPLFFPETILYILDENGQRIQSYRLSADGTLEFELLPFDQVNVRPVENEDRSILTVQFQGQVYKKQPGDLGKGEPVTIIDERGETVAIAYTRESGRFQFDQVEPKLNYLFRLSEKSKAEQIAVTDRGKEIVLPVLEQEAVYHRLKKSEAILIVNDRNDTLYIAPEDVFIINRVYYDYNSAQLTQTAQKQLEQLSRILRKNLHVNLDLTSYCDSRGSDAYNQQLSEKRAISVMKFLAESGVERSRMSGRGKGKTNLLNNCSSDQSCSEEEHAINRRTEIRLLKK